RIVSIDTAKAAALPGVHVVLTGADVANRLAGRALRDVPILAVGKVRFAGEMVAAAAAETPETAEEAIGLLRVEYEPLPAVFDVDEALQPDAPAIHEEPWSYPGAVRGKDEPPNVVSYALWICGDNVDQAMAKADRVFEHTFSTQKVHQGYIEPHCCTVEFNPQGRVRVWSCNKAPYKLREHLAATFDLAVDDVEAYSAAIGGDFGGKGSPMDIPLCLELSRRSGRPVRMLRTYIEELTAGDPRHATRTTIRMGVGNDGRIQALDIRALFNAGAYGGYRPGPKMQTAPGTSYRYPAARVEAIRVYTNEVPCGNARAPGAPQTTFAFESMMELVARQMDIDPFEFRRRNVLENGEPSLMGAVWPEVRGRETIDAAERAAGEAQLPAPSPNIRVGRGVAMYDRPTHAPQRTSLRLTLLPDAHIEAQVPIQETGTGSHTMLQGVIATALGIDPNRIIMRYVGTTHLPYDEGVGGSRVTVSAAEAGVLTAQAFLEEMEARVADQLGVPADQVHVQPGGYCMHLASGQQMGLEDLAAAGVKLEAVGDTGVGEHAPGDAATSFCLQVAQVGVDVETGEITLYDFLSVHDVADILNPIAHRGQIEGGIAMGLGYALSEDLGLQDGRVSASHLGEYKLPTMPDMPPLRVVLLPGGKGVGAKNVKSIGEMGNVPTAAAVANAVSDALGVCMDSLPVTAEKVRAALG
ncbi:MAG TPA: xanthine dehydrogenase family protein molybdopterin-binding subunit, partial [Chloroflexota bacterium]|nr:xanthine dehydrogenase family protein molybdopterin-binding subunit [Chloroflexota bacterium]